MKALALDTAISCITISAKNDDYLASLVLDIGMRQSEKLLPAIDYVLKQADLTPADLDYTVLAEGPGSFTGLRLGFAALKAIELFGGRSDSDKNVSQNQNMSQARSAYADREFAPQTSQTNSKISRIPLYAINTLDAYAWPFLDFDGIILPVIDAHKDKFYAKAFLNKKEILNCDDWDLRALEEKLLSAANENSLQAQEASQNENSLQDQKPAAGKILVCGQEAKTFIDACKENGLFGQNDLLAAQGRFTSLESLFALAEQKIASGQPPLADYDGPQYFRASEAEQNLPSA